MQDIRSSVVNVESIQALRAMINSGLDCMETDLREYREKEHSRYLKVSDKNKQMLRKLVTLERGSDQLKQTVREEKKFKNGSIDWPE